MSMNIGEQLKLRRLKSGFTQEQIAARMNITRQTLSNWEVGKNTPDINSIIVLARIYCLSLDELLLGKIFYKGAFPMKKKLTEVEIEALIKRHYPAALNFKELHGGLVSQTYSFQEGENRLIFQIGNGLETYEKKKWIYKNFKAILPLREVLEVNVTENGSAYSISKFIEGSTLHNLNSQEFLDSIPSIMKTLEILEQIDVTDSEGYGLFDKEGHAAYPTWLDFIKAPCNENIYNWSALEINGLDSEVVKSAIQELKAHISSVTLSKKHLVHGDLGSFNLVVKDDQIVGVIDWGLALYGDHLYDKANILFWNEDKLQPLYQQIIQRYITSPESKEKMYCYMLRIGLEELYNTVILKYIGYDIEWVANRLQKIMDDFKKKYLN